ncbi:hypothetical protein EON83_29705 [bacterium]|nr:MAG: hypothetical protein EON83_29705 [bacterium]
MSAHKPIHFPATRDGALRAAKAFAPQMGFRYASERNRVMPGHPFVSRLAPAIRVRLISEREVTQIALAEFGSLHRCEKFVQEANWRNYWRSWLELHPEIWQRYLRTRDEARLNLTTQQRHRIAQLEAGNSGCEPMDNFARELVETGYLHNHARMWFAAYWIHTEHLPWQLGADFFDRNLICSCAASNTLSWRWVVGLQTPGKSYLARRSNLEKYCDSAYLGNKIGLERLQNPTPLPITPDPISLPIQPDFELEIGDLQGNTALWITEDDLSPETCAALSQTNFTAICTSVIAPSYQPPNSNGLRRAYRLQAAQDAAHRAQEKWAIAPTNIEAANETDLAHQLVTWAKSAEIQTIVALKPFIGPSHDALQPLQTRLQTEGIELRLLRRPEDAEMLPHATSGFFKFWQAIKNAAIP